MYKNKSIIYFSYPQLYWNIYYRIFTSVINSPGFIAHDCKCYFKAGLEIATILVAYAPEM